MRWVRLGIGSLLALWAATAQGTELAFQVDGPKRLSDRLSSGSSIARVLDDEGAEISEVLAATRAEYRRLLAALYADGYYSGTISIRVDGQEAADLSPFAAPRQISRIDVTVDPGPPFNFGTARAAPLPETAELPSGFATGERARVSAVRGAAQAGTTAWRQAGHAKAELSAQTITARHPQAELDVDLQFTPGPKLRFGSLTITGNERVRTERIREIAGYPEGEVFDPDEIDDALDRLRRTEAFRSITLTEAETPNADGTLPMELSVTEQKRRRLSVGAEISTDDGGALFANWTHRNLRGGAEQLQLEFAISSIGSSAFGASDQNGENFLLSATYRRPATFSPDTDLQFSAVLESVDDPGGNYDSLTLSGGVVHRFSDELTGTLSVSLEAGPVEDAFGERDIQAVSLPATLAWDRRDDPLDATSGTYVFLDAKPFVGTEGVDAGLKFVAEGRAYQGFGSSTVLAGRLALGTVAGADADRTPPGTLFIIGGSGTVRGQPYEEIGVGEQNGFIVGGRSLVLATGEVRQNIRDALSVVAFFDAGYVGSEEFYDGSGTWATGAGLGVRYDTGLGPIRVDLATPITGGPDDAPDLQIYIGIGQAF